MVPYYGDFAEDDTVLIPFNTFSSDDPSASVTITDLADADIKVHKDGSTTEIATDGATVAIDFDSRTGAHLITIDTSVHADYSTGSEYGVLIEGTTVDGGTVTAWVGTFSIERAGGALALLKNATYGLSALESLIDDIGAAGAGLTAIPWNSDWDAEVQSEVADALDAAMPATPTANSLNERVLFTKYAVVNKQTITEASGNTTIYKDNDSDAYCTVAAAYSSDSTTTTRKRLE